MERIVTSMYKVISYFTDLQDFNHPYKVGDEFPRLGLKVSDKRLEELASNKNKQGKPLIKKVEEPKQDDFSQHMNAPEIKEESTEVKYTKTEINRMSTAKLKEVAKMNRVEDADDMTGAKLKEVLIEKFEL